jgi:hypothetical protein
MFRDNLTLIEKLEFASIFGYVFLGYNVLIFMVNIVIDGVKLVKKIIKILLTKK